MIRETCICETPMRSPISACVRSSSKRSRRTSRSRGVTARRSWASVARSSASPKPSSLVPTRVAERVARLVLVAARRRQRRRAVGAGRLERLEHVLLARRRPPRRSRPTVGCAAQVGRQLADLAVDAQRELLQVARDAHRPRAVAEVALDLAEDRRHRVAREGDVARQVEAVDRLDEAQAGDLEEVVEAAPRGAGSGARAGARAAGSARRAARGRRGRGCRGSARTARGRSSARAASGAPARRRSVAGGRRRDHRAHHARRQRSAKWRPMALWTVRRLRAPGSSGAGVRRAGGPDAAHSTSHRTASRLRPGR